MVTESTVAAWLRCAACSFLVKSVVVLDLDQQNNLMRSDKKFKSQSFDSKSLSRSDSTISCFRSCIKELKEKNIIGKTIFIVHHMSLNTESLIKKRFN